MNGFELGRKLGIAALASVAFVGCSGGGLRNAMSWIGPDKYSPLDATAHESAGDPVDNALVADAEASQKESFRSRIARRMPWNRDLPPDPFLDPDQQPSGVSVAQTPPARTSEVRTVGLSSDSDPVIQPKSPDQPTVEPLRTRSTKSDDKPATDADADLDAIEQMLADMERDLQRPLNSRRDAAATERARPVFKQPAENDISRQMQAAAERSARRFEELAVHPGDPTVDIDRLLAESGIAHDRHATQGEGLDRNIRHGYSPEDFDRLLGVSGTADVGSRPADSADWFTRESAAAAADVPATDSGAKDPFTVAGDHAGLASAAAAFDRTLFGDKPAAFWEAAPQSVADEFAGRDPFIAASHTTVGSGNADQPLTPPAGFDAGTFPVDPFFSAAPQFDEPVGEESPFSLASSTRERGPAPALTVPPAADTTASRMSPPAPKFSSDPFFETDHSALIDDPPPAIPGEVAAIDATPEVAIAADRPGFSVRNGLLFIGGVIVVILLMSPGRRQQRNSVS